MAVPTMTNNSPIAGSIAWGAFNIQYQGVTYAISAGSTTQRWVWWRYNGGSSVIEAGPDVPTTLTGDDLVLFGNKSGIGVRVQSASLLDGELIVDGSIFADAIAANQIASNHIVTAGLDAGVVKFGTMNGDRIAVNTLQGDRLLAQSVLASKLAVADWENYVSDPYFDLQRWTQQTGVTYATISDMPLGIGAGIVQRFTGGGTRETWSMDKFSSLPSETHRISCFVRKITNAASPAGTVAVRMRFYDAAGNNTTPFYFEMPMNVSDMVQNTWYELAIPNAIVPAGFTDSRVDMLTIGATAGDNFEFAIPQANKKKNGKLVVDGSITGDQVQARSIRTTELAADAITADLLTAGDALVTGLLSVGDAVAQSVATAGLYVGPNISLTEEGGLVVRTPTGTTILPADGQAPVFTGSATFDALTANGNLKIQGITNEIAKGSTVKMASGISAPKVKPSGSTFWPSHAIHDGYNPRGFAYHLASDSYYHTESLGGCVVTKTKRNATTGDYEFQFGGQIAVTSATDNGNGAWNRPEVTSGMGGVAIIGNSMYVLCDTNENIVGTFSGKMYVYKGNYNSSTGKWDYERRWLYDPNTSGLAYMGGRGKYRPSIGPDEIGSAILIAQCDDLGAAWISTYDSVGTSLSKFALNTSAATTTQWKPAKTIMSVSFHNAPIGGTPSDTNKYSVVLDGEAQVRAFDTSTHKENIGASGKFTLPTTACVGFRWDYQLGRFTTRSAKVVYDHSAILISQVSAVMTWRKADGTGPDFGQYETDKSPPWITTTFPYRAYLQLDSGTIPDDITDPNDPDSVSFYVAQNDLSGTNASFHREATPAAGVKVVTLGALTGAGGNPPAAPNFPAATPARFTSDDGTLISLSGSGAWRLGDISGDANGRAIGGAFVPICGVLPFMGGLAVPTGYTLLWGGTISEATYPLAVAILIAAGLSSTGTAPNRVVTLPDLRDRVIYGSGTTRGFNTSGGSDTVTMPDHNHGSGTYVVGNTNLTQQTNTSTTSGSALRLTGPVGHDHGLSGSSGIVVGTNPAQSTVPKYWAMNYIMRLT